MGEAVVDVEGTRAVPASTDPPSRTTQPAENSRRAPNRSESRPPSNSRPPKATRNALTTQVRLAWENPRSVFISGSAIPTIEVSMITTN
jgi:hypothetical protein